MFLWDSNILRHYGEGNQTLAKHLESVSFSEIALPSIVLAEVLRGRADFVLKATVEQSVLAHKYFLQTLKMLQTFQIVQFDEKSAQILKKLQSKYQSKKRYADLWIAATILSQNHILITRNVKHFADILPKNQLQNWID